MTDKAFTVDDIALAVEIPGLYDGTAVYLMRDGRVLNRFRHRYWPTHLRAGADTWIAEHGDRLRAQNADLLDQETA